MTAALLSPPEARTLVELLRFRAENDADQTAFTFYEEDHAGLTFGELDRLARAVAALIQEHAAPEDRVLLLYPPGREYVLGFLGCLYAGVIAVPAYPPDPSRLGRTLPRLTALVTDCDAKLALTSSMIAELLGPLVEDVPPLKALQWVSTSDAVDPSGWEAPPLVREDVAFLQYTSGSTGTPRGVMLTHGNLLHNLGLIAQGFAATPPARGVIWLPPYHDMGLIGGILQPLYAKIPTSLMSPLTFLQNPAGWVEEISRLAGQGNVISGGPNFAFDLAVRKTTPEQRAQLDLRHWEVAFCGAEPIRAETLRRFSAAFAVSGFRPEALYPCYGLAEGTLIVTGGPRRGTPVVRTFDPGSVSGGAPATGEGLELVGSGTIIGDQTLEIVHPQTRRRLPPGEVGELWVSGGSVASGYWQRPEETEAQLRARLAEEDGRTYLRTGDLGFLLDGELFVTGREKDLIILRGQNLYPQDLELTAERAHPALRPGCVAAFGFERAGSGEEQVAVVIEAQRGADPQTLEEAIAAIRRAVSDGHAVHVDAVALIRPGSLPKTSSGKVQRRATRSAFLDGTLELLSSSGAAETPAVRGMPPAPAQRTEAALTEWICAASAALSGGPPPAPGASLSELGLDSLRAMELSAHLGGELGVDFGVAELLRAQTPLEVAQLLTAALARATPAQSPEPPEDAAALTDGQRSLWLQDRLEPGRAAYNISRAVRLEGALDTPALQRAFAALATRHPLLRSVFRGEVRLEEASLPALAIVDASGLSAEQLQRRLEEEALRPFELDGGQLVRAQLYEGAGAPVLLLVLHHAIADFWAMAVLARELGLLYAAERSGRPAPLPPPGTTMAALAREERARLAGTRGEALRAYWRGALLGAEPRLQLERHATPGAPGGSQRFVLSEESSEAVLRLSREEQTTPFVVLLAAYFAFLHRWTGQDRLTVGAPTAGRADRRTQGVLGYLVNPVALTAEVTPETGFRALVQRVKSTVLGALAHADLPLSRVAEAVGRAGPLYETMFVYQQAPGGDEALTAMALDAEGAALTVGGLQAAAVPLTVRATPVELALVAGRVRGRFEGGFEYRRDRLADEAVRRMAARWTAFAGQLVAAPDAAVTDHPWVDREEREQLLWWGRGEAAAAPFVPLPQRVAGWAQRTPDRAALVRGTQSLTYAQLTERVHRLAGQLAALGVGPEQPVAVAVERTVEGIVALLALLELGAIYVPLELRHPDPRLSFMVGDVKAKWILTQTAHLPRVQALGAEHGATVVDLDRPLAGEGRPSNRVAPSQPAYVIYTSGSTGQPKGVLVPHQGLSNLAEAQIRGFGVTPESRVLQFASCGFDAAISEIAMALGAGACLHLMPATEKHPALELPRVLRADRITTVTLPPSLLAVLDPAGLPDLQTVITAGEPCSEELVARWAKGRTFINAYGPTETSVCASFGRCEPEGTAPGIGRPLQNLRLYVVDPSGELAPVGAAGELWVGGVGVALGYVDRPALTAERFIPDPFSPDGGRLYRTGDRVRWRADGTLQFLGRMDDQVKIRGHRVELGEVEAALRRHLPIQDAAVTTRVTPSGETLLCAYLVGAELPPERELRARLKPHVPDAHLPSAFVTLPALPLTANGKVDRRALPAPVLSAPADRPSTPPQTALEQTVASAWGRALGRSAVGVHEHFFEELGGSSITVMQAAANLREALGRDVPLTHFFEHPTVHAFARYLEGGAQDSRDDARARADARRDALNRRLRGKS